MLKEFQASLAEGTWKNKRAHLERLLQFCTLHSLDPTELGEYDVMSYIVFLKKLFKSPTSVLNYLSGARTWFSSVTGGSEPFDSYKVSVLKKGLKRTMHHNTVRAQPFGPDHLKYLVRVFEGVGTRALVLKAFITMAFFSALRQSNLLLRNVSDKPVHTLRAKDVLPLANELQIVVRSSKTLKSSSSPLCIKLPKLGKSSCCPLRNWNMYVAGCKERRSELAFLDVEGLPLTSRVATKVIRLALVGSTYPEPGKFTLHACRRGAAQALAKKGASINQIKRLGQWSSKAVHTYVPKSNIIQEAETLKAYFG